MPEGCTLATLDSLNWYLGYKEYAPTHLFSQLIKRYRTLESHDDGLTENAPDGCMDIIFNFLIR